MFVKQTSPGRTHVSEPNRNHVEPRTKPRRLWSDGRKPSGSQAETKADCFENIRLGETSLCGTMSEPSGTKAGTKHECLRNRTRRDMATFLNQIGTKWNQCRNQVKTKELYTKAMLLWSARTPIIILIKRPGGLCEDPPRSPAPAPVSLVL